MTTVSNLHPADAYSHLQRTTAPKQLVNQTQSHAAIGSDNNNPELRDVFTQFVGETFFQQMMSAMRQTVDKPAYFHGGRAEEVFQKQLDQVLSERMTEASAEEFADPMYELFMMRRG